MDHPIICFGQQPCGFFPKRFLFAKIVTARRLQKEIGGEIVFFCHDSDHDPRETTTILRDQHEQPGSRSEFSVRESDPKAIFSALCETRSSGMARENCTPTSKLCTGDLVEHFKETRSSNVADFCLEMYTRMGLLDGVRVERSSAPQFRARAAAVSDYFVDQPYEGEIVRARYRDGKLLLHKGGDRFLEIPGGEFGPEQISPTRDTRFVWMQSVIRCTHYVAGASEQDYVNKADAPEVKFVRRDEISDSGKSYTEG